MKQYNQNIEKLLDLGKELIGKVDYKELGLNSNDGHHLLKMVIDDKFHFSTQSKNHPYAPIHAIYALGNLKIQECFDEVSNLTTKYKDDKYIKDAIKAYAKFLNPEAEVVEEKIIEEVAPIVKEEEPKEEIVEEKIIEEVKAEEPKEEIAPIVKEEEPKEEIVEEKIIEEVKAEELKEEIAPIVEEEIKEEVVEEKVIEEVKVEEPKAEEIIVIESDKLIKEAIDEMQQDKPRPKKQRAPVKQPEKIVKVGRNDPCPCGSGKKYKKCCINL
jgi:uncharacterized protein YecA (UPF0149 family)